MIQREPEGDRWSGAPCWQVAKLLKTAATAGGWDSQSDVPVLTYMDGAAASLTF